MKINKGSEHTKAILKLALTVNRAFLSSAESFQALPQAHGDLTWPKVLVDAAGPGGLVTEGSQREVAKTLDSLKKKKRVRVYAPCWTTCVYAYSSL